MTRKQKLAELILLEAEALSTAQGVDNQVTLAEELTKDAIALAKLVQEERKVA